MSSGSGPSRETFPQDSARNTAPQSGGGFMAPTASSTAQQSKLANEAVQTRKIRRVREDLFLSEMERLADAMCQHYVNSATMAAAQQHPDLGGTNSSTTAGGAAGAGVVPIVPTSDIRRHVGTIQASIQQQLLQETKAMGNDLALHIGTVNAELDSRGGSRKAGGRQGQGTANSSSALPSGFEELDSGRFKTVDVHNTGEFQGSWQPQSTAGVASRLRGTAGGAPESMLPSLPIGQTSEKLLSQRVEPSPLVINHVRTSNDDLQMIDVNMDGNTAPLSCRRRKSDKIQDSLRKGAPPPPPQPPLTARLPRDVVNDYFRRSTVTGASCSSMGSSVNSRIRPTIKKKGIDGMPWSPRDAAITMATSPRMPNSARNTGLDVEGLTTAPPLVMSSLVSRIPLDSPYHNKRPMPPPTSSRSSSVSTRCSQK